MTDRVDLQRKEQVERYGGKQVEQKPASDVVASDLTRLVDDLAALTHKRRAEIECNVYIRAHPHRHSGYVHIDTSTSTSPGFRLRVTRTSFVCRVYVNVK